jgi:hypothetical protein
MYGREEKRIKILVRKSEGGDMHKWEDNTIIHVSQDRVQ